MWRDCSAWLQENREVWVKGSRDRWRKFGKRKYHRGRGVDGVWVFGGRKRGKNKCSFESVSNRRWGVETLIPIIKRWVLPRSRTIIHSDCWKAYSSPEREGYKRKTVNHSVDFVDSDSGVYTQNIESRWRALKTWRCPGMERNKELYDSYFAEICCKAKISGWKLRWIYKISGTACIPPKVKDQVEECQSLSVTVTGSPALPLWQCQGQRQSAVLTLTRRMNVTAVWTFSISQGEYTIMISGNFCGLWLWLAFPCVVATWIMIFSCFAPVLCSAHMTLVGGALKRLCPYSHMWGNYDGTIFFT